jgi:hypothetical protein
MECAVGLLQLYGIPACGSPDEACLAATRAPSNVPLIVPGTGCFLKAASPVSGMPVTFRPALDLSEWQGARLIGVLLGAMLSVLVTSRAPNLVS